MSTKTDVRKIDKSEGIEVNDLNTPLCSIYGSKKDNHPACKACLTAFKARHKACIELTAKTADKKNVKKITGMSLDCFNFRIESDTHKFINAIAKTALTMKAVKLLQWNERPNTFYCAFGKLQKSGYAKKDKKSKTLILTPKGLKKLETWKANRKAENRKVA